MTPDEWLAWMRAALADHEPGATVHVIEAFSRGVPDRATLGMEAIDGSMFMLEVKAVVVNEAARERGGGDGALPHRVQGNGAPVRVGAAGRRALQGHNVVVVALGVLAIVALLAVLLMLLV